MNDFIGGLQEKLERERKDRYVMLGTARRLLEAMFGGDNRRPQETRQYAVLQDVLNKIAE